jgi:hypothetical protein
MTELHERVTVHECVAVLETRHDVKETLDRLLAGTRDAK